MGTIAVGWQGCCSCCMLWHSATQVQQPLRSTQRGRKIVVVWNDTQPPKRAVLKVRGFSYSNSRIGEGPGVDSDAAGFDSLSRVDICEQDFPAMRKLNTNAIKIYAFNTVNQGLRVNHSKCLDLAWNGGVKPIFVSLSIWIPTLPFPTEAVRTDMVDRYFAMVTETKGHAAVFSYSIGSEIGGDPNNNEAYWSDFNLVAHAVRRALGTAKKLITTGTYQADCSSCQPVVPVIGHVINGERYKADVDVWGVDIYSPNPDEP